MRLRQGSYKRKILSITQKVSDLFSFQIYNLKHMYIIDDSEREGEGGREKMLAEFAIRYIVAFKTNWKQKGTNDIVCSRISKKGSIRTST